MARRPNRRSDVDRKLLGERIARARMREGLTQRELAERVGASHRAVQQWEAGTRAPLRYLGQLEQALGLARESLLRGTLEPPRDEFSRLIRKIEEVQQKLLPLEHVVRELLALLESGGFDVADLRNELGEPARGSTAGTKPGPAAENAEEPPPSEAR